MSAASKVHPDFLSVIKDPSKDLITVARRVVELGIASSKLTITKYANIGKIAVAIYRKVYEANPPSCPEIVYIGHLIKKSVHKNDKEDSIKIPTDKMSEIEKELGVYFTHVWAYPRSDVPMIDAAIDQVIYGKPKAK